MFVGIVVLVFLLFVLLLFLWFVCILVLVSSLLLGGLGLV